MAFVGKSGRHSVLEEDASLFQAQEPKTEKQKWKEMNHTQRLQYIKDYYLFKYLAILALAICAGIFVWSAIKPQKETQIFFAVVHNMMLPEEKQELEQLFAETFITDPKQQEICIDDSFPVSYESDAKLSTYLAANEIDVIVTNESHFQSLAKNGFFQDFNTFMPKFAKSHSKNLYWTDGSLDEPPEDSVIDHTAVSSFTAEKAYGIDVSHCGLIRQSWHQEEKAILGITVNSSHPDHAAIAVQKLFRYL